MSAPAAPRSVAARLTQWTINVLLVAVTLVSAAYLVPTLIGYERYVITGGSMSGTFEKGSIAFEKPVDVSELAVGDVITYLPPPDSGVGTLVTHRIVGAGRSDTGARVFRTQGDANADRDPWKFTLDEGTQPTVQFTVPLVGYALIALADRETRMLVIGLPAALIALLAMVELAGAVRKDGPSDAAVPPAVALPAA
jgi:signal peptidase I